MCEQIVIRLCSFHPIWLVVQAQVIPELRSLLALLSTGLHVRLPSGIKQTLTGEGVRHPLVVATSTSGLQRAMQSCIISRAAACTLSSVRAVLAL